MFQAISRASLMELQYFVILSRDLKYINAEEFNTIDELITEVSKILYSFTKSMQ